MKIKKLGLVIVFALVFFLSASTAVEAKYVISQYGHNVMRYTHEDISSSFKPYVDYIDYDIASVPCNGARLHFTSFGKTAVVLYPNLAEAMAKSVMAAPEWTGDRSLKSVKWEIIQHGIWPNRMVVDIEYHYADLKSWELPYKNY